MSQFPFTENGSMMSHGAVPTHTSAAERGLLARLLRSACHYRSLRVDLSWFTAAFGCTFLWIMLEAGRALALGVPFNTAAALWAFSTLVGLGLHVRFEE